jgi:hypothetical protein
MIASTAEVERRNVSGRNKVQQQSRAEIEILQ